MVLALFLIGAVGLPAVLLPSAVLRLVTGAASGDVNIGLTVGGLTAGAISHFFLRKRKTYRFLSTFHHEVGHMLFAILFIAPPIALTSTRGQGSLQHEPPRGRLRKTKDFLITIAPYWFSPVLVIPLAWCWLQLPDTWSVRFLLSAVAGLSLTLPVSQIHPGQSDLVKYKLVIPVVAAVWLWAAQAVMVVSVLTNWSIRVVPSIYEFSLRAF